MSADPKSIYFLQENLDEDFSWRIQELSNFKNSIPRDKGNIQNSLIRAGIALLYAHWEGFVKEGASQYYKFVSHQTHNVGDFHSGFISILLSGEVNELLETKKIKRKTILFDKIINELNKEAFFPNISPIRTSNLTYNVFEDVCIMLNINIDEFQLNEEFINKQLVDKRNMIAHGKYLDVDYKIFNEEIYLKVVKILRMFKNQVLNSAVQKKYLK